MLSQNPNAIHILEKNLDKINWKCLSSNPNAIPLLEKKLDKIDWSVLHENPNAVEFLQNYIQLGNNLHKINWEYFLYYSYTEPLLFNLDCQKMRECFYPISKEIVEYVFHPNRVFRIAEKFGIDVADYLDLI
jgi:hypothetical protein